MSKPAVHSCFPVVFFEDPGHGGHVGIRIDPAVVDIGEVMLAVVAFLVEIEADRAPEALDVAKHLGPERPDSGHPVAVQAPDQIMADEVVELVS